MEEFVLCSECFKDQGLKLDAFNVGIESQTSCPNCNGKNGRKLNKELVAKLAYRFFVVGTIHRTPFGGAPVIQFNEHQYNNSDIQVSNWLKNDVELIEESIGIGFFHYGPRMWMVGEVEPLKSLKDETQREDVINQILETYPKIIFSKDDIFYRLRKNPDEPTNFDEYDSPPDEFLGKNRLDSADLPIMYGSQDLEVCIHECRVTIEDELFVATLSPKEDLRLLDLTELIEQDVTEFESLDMAIHMLFLAAEHSYEITREIAFLAYQAGFDGLIYPSYFSLVRTGAIPFDTLYGISVRRFPSYKEHAKAQTIPNIALFGRPINKSIVEVKCINKLALKKANYNFHFGPVEY